MVVVVVVSFQTGSRQKASLNLPEHSSATASFLTCCLHFHKELKLLYIPEQRYGANDRREDFMTNHNESYLRRPGIELELLFLLLLYSVWLIL